MPILIITDGYGRECFLGPRAERPSSSWRKIQILPPISGKPWFHAYPISGGAVLTQVKNNPREATQDDVDRACQKFPFNPAKDAILALWANR